MPRYVRTAYFGNLSELQRDIAAAARAGRVDRAGVVDLAEAVARREVRTSRGAEAIERIHQSRSCFSAVELEIRERAKSSDEAGAAAELALLEAGRISPARAVELHARASDGAFRAVAARATKDKERAGLRRSFYADPDERVRAAALRAAAEARDPDDFDLLFDAARLDPNGDNRATAARALGAVGGERAALSLVDLWSSADQEVRFAIVDAWSSMRVFPNGGAEQLLRVAESQSTLEAVAAASALARIGEQGEREGRAVLVRAVGEGTSEQRTTAVALVPLDADGIGALDKAASSDDAVVRVTALGRLLAVPARKARALSSLEALAKEANAAARQARDALAEARDPQAVPLLEKDLTVGSPGHRRKMAVGLFEMGRPGAMAAALADPDPSVRMSVACTILAADGKAGNAT